MKRFFDKVGHFFVLLFRLFYVSISPLRRPITSIDSDYVVSLTSYGYRIRKSWITLKSILLQKDFNPKYIILWISFDDSKLISKRIKRYESKGLTIRCCEDYLSYKKVLETAKTMSHLKIITADDDIIYGRYHFSKLIELSKKNPSCVCCYKAHRIRFDENHTVKKYIEWDFGSDGYAGPSLVLVPIGYQGILYPKDYFSNKSFLDYEKIKSIAPKQDDLWLKFIGLKKGIKAVKVFSKDFYTPETPRTQKQTLFKTNIIDNDLAIKKLQSFFSIELSSLVNFELNEND